jgi:hypothetical protein
VKEFTHILTTVTNLSLFMKMLNIRLNSGIPSCHLVQYFSSSGLGSEILKTKMCKPVTLYRAYYLTVKPVPRLEVYIEVIWQQNAVEIIRFLVRRKKKNSVAVVRKRTIRPSDRRLSAKLVPTFAGRGCCVVSATNSHGR